MKGQPQTVPGSLARLLACNDSAIGGAALRRIERVEYDLDIVEPTFSVRGVYVAQRSGTARIDIFAAGERVFSEGWDGDAGWQLPTGASAPTPTSDDGAAALRHGIEQPGHLWTLQDMAANGHRVEDADALVEPSTAARAVKLTLKDGFDSWYWIDTSTCLVRKKRDFRAFHPDVEPERRWIESRFADFRSAQGVMRPWATYSVDLVTGDTVGTTRITAVRTRTAP